MGFRDLEKVLDEALPKISNDPFRYAYIRCLREINGNLDSISLSMRAIVETMDRSRVLQEQLLEVLKNGTPAKKAKSS